MSKKWVTVDEKDLELIRNYAEMGIEAGWKEATDLGKLYLRLSKTQKKITVASAKAKGRNLQQWVCKRISEITGLPYNQQDDGCEIHSREMGQQGTDIVLRGTALKRFPFSVECKASESLNLKDTVDQAKSNTYAGTDWIIVHNKKAISDTLVIMSWDTFEKLVKERKA